MARRENGLSSAVAIIAAVLTAPFHLRAAPICGNTDDIPTGRCAESQDDALILMTERYCRALTEGVESAGSPYQKSVPEIHWIHSECGQGLNSPTPADPSGPFCITPRSFREQTWSARYETLGLFATITAIGIANWEWGSSGFHFNGEGWFGEDTGSGGMDKLGHAYTTYLMTDFLTDAIQDRSSDSRGGEITAALLSISLTTYVEVFDGYSGDHGFSYEDLLMDVLGAGFSVVRNKVPGLREKIDFRFQYLPSPDSSFNPFGDYEGQKYLIAVKLAGFDELKETPLRRVELHGGYYARGFSDKARRAGEPRDQEFYVGLGLNLGELLFGEGPHRDHRFSKAARTTLGYVQLPYTYLSSDGNSGR